MRVLLTTQPGLGHLYPMLPLAYALKQAGHTIAFACSASFVPEVEKFGFQAFATGVDWLESEPELAFPEMEEMEPKEWHEYLSEIFVDISANQMTYDLLALCREWSPDVLVRDYTEYGACIAGEVLNIPHAVVDYEIYLPNYITKLIMENPLAYLRSAYGLEPYPAMDMLNKYLYFSTLPPSYQLYPLPAVTQFLPRTNLTKAGNDSLPDWVAHLADQPTIYVSMGTVVNRIPEIYKTILDALCDEAVNLIMLIGRNQDTEQFGPVPENVHIEQFLPQTALMPYCDIVINHGGAGTITTGLAHGLPMLVIPMVGHWWLHAARCTNLKVGVALQPPEEYSIDFDLRDGSTLNGAMDIALSLFSEKPPSFSITSVREAVRTLLTDNRYRQAAQQLQTETANLPPLEHAVYLLEQLAVERKPITTKPKM